MANATSSVKQAFVFWDQEFYLERSVETLSAETQFYQVALLGVDTTGYYCKGDDTQSWILAGIVAPDNGNPKLPAGTADDGTLELKAQRPRFLRLTIASIAVTDIGKTVYALDDQTGTLDPSATTYANVVGQVVDKVATNIALVELAYDGIAANARLQAAKWLAATGAQTLSKYDVGKKIFLPNTGAYTVTLPAVADVPHGGELWFLKTTTDAEIVTLDGNASENIDGATTLGTIDAAYDTALLVNNGTRWIVMARDIT